MIMENGPMEKVGPMIAVKNVIKIIGHALEIANWNIVTTTN